jgi:hypothetical protein
MQQTEAAEARLEEVIDGHQEEAITLHQGHSSETARRFYLKRDAHRVAKQAVEAHGNMYGPMPSTLKRLRESDDDPYVPPLNEVSVFYI